MHYFCGIGMLSPSVFYGFAEHCGPMFAAWSSDRNSEIALAFLNVMRNQIGEQAFDAFKELAGLRERTNVTANFRIFAGEAPQPGNRMRIGKKADVENQICVGGHAVAIAKAHDRNEHGALVWIFETFGDEAAEFVDVELRTVDDDIGEFADGLHHVAFLAKALAHGNIFAEGMRATRLAVAAQERIFTGINEHQRNGMIFAQVFEKRRQFFELRSLAGVDEQGGAREITFAGGMQLGENGN